MKKKTFRPFLSFFLCLSFCSACQVREEEVYSDDLPFRLDLKNESLTILQFTDLHLTFGIDHNDRQTFNLIDRMINHTHPDLIVFSGDQTMAPFAVELFKMLGKRVEKHQIPWTFVFGNHDDDHCQIESYFPILKDFPHLMFKVGPKITDGGYGNFRLHTYFNDLPFYNVYLLDSHREAPGNLNYGWLSEAQVAWYQEHVQVDTVPHLVYMHIPLLEFHEVETSTLHDGHKSEGIYPQGKNTGFFQAMVDSTLARALFVGHDHENSFSFYHQGILLGYGVASGFNGYGQREKGARLVKIDQSKTLTTEILLASEVGL